MTRPAALGVLAVSALVFLGFLLLMPRTTSDMRILCAHNLKQLYVHSLMFADRKGTRAFPHSPEGSLAALQALVEDQGEDFNPRLLVCPMDEKAEVLSSGVKWILTETSTSYEIVPWPLEITAQNAILMYDKKPYHAGARHVVFTDSSIRLLEEAEFLDLFERERKRFGLDARKLRGEMVPQSGLQDMTPKPKVLFVCIENAGRSQMAEAFARSLGLDAHSCGSAPAAMVNPAAVEAMKEKGLDISGKAPKGFGAVPRADVVVTMGCGDACPYVPGKRHDWELPDPRGQGLDEVRKIRDEIERRVRDLAREMGVAMSGARVEVEGMRGRGKKTALLALALGLLVLILAAVVFWTPLLSGLRGWFGANWGEYRVMSLPPGPAFLGGVDMARGDIEVREIAMFLSAWSGETVVVAPELLKETISMPRIENVTADMILGILDVHGIVLRCKPLPDGKQLFVLEATRPIPPRKMEDDSKPIDAGVEDEPEPKFFRSKAE